MLGTLEGIVLLKDGSIKITLPMAAGTRLGDLDALRGHSLRVEAVPDTPDTSETAPLSKRLIDAVVALETARANLLSLLPEIKSVEERERAYSAMKAAEVPQLSLGRCEAGDLPDEIPETREEVVD